MLQNWKQPESKPKEPVWKIKTDWILRTCVPESTLSGCMMIMNGFRPAEWLSDNLLHLRKLQNMWKKRTRLGSLFISSKNNLTPQFLFPETALPGFKGGAGYAFCFYCFPTWLFPHQDETLQSVPLMIKAVKRKVLISCTPIHRPHLYTLPGKPNTYQYLLPNLRLYNSFIFWELIIMA